MTTNQPRSLGTRLWWIIRTLILVILLVALVAAIVAGLGYAGYLGVQEIQRSNNSLTMRIEANEQNLNSLRDLVNAEFAEGNPEQQVQINQLENELAQLTSQLEALQAANAENTTEQSNLLTSLQTELATAVAQNSDLTTELETIQAALVALQSDLNTSGSRIDSLGGDLDQLRLQLSALDDTLAAVSTETAAARDADPDNLQQTVTLLQLWAVISHARLLLADGEVTSAETAVAQAATLANSLTAEPGTPAAASLTRLQTRLNLAADGITTTPSTAAQDLESASQELAVLLSGTTAESENIELTPTPAPGDAEATPAPVTTETPQPSPTPSP